MYRNGLNVHDGNGMISRGWGIHKEEDDKEYNLFNDPDYLFELAAELARTDWERIRAEKGDE